MGPKRNAWVSLGQGNRRDLLGKLERRWGNGIMRKRVGWPGQGRRVGGWTEGENNLIVFIICWGQVREKSVARKL